jgi:serine/threonine protein kinase
MLNKRLDDDDLQMEEDVLRVIDEQNHNNIMNIIAFYSWRDQVNFVFPCVDRNLYQVLHQDWKPENFPMPQRDCRGHWLWEQLIDVADALRTIHNPPKNPWPELGKIVGFHFDLKPANIMARRDGRLLVTDFGQSMVKFVQNNQPAYGDYIGGDYGYQPPEVCPSRTQWKEIKEAAEHSGSPVPTSPSIMTVTSFPPPPRKDSHATVSSVYSRRESRRGLGSFSGVSTAANESILSHGTSSSQSQLSPSTYSEVSRVTATTNYDVWSLACIMLEAFVFIYRGGSSGIEAFESDRRAEERALSFHDGNGANARLKTCVDRLLDEFRTLHIGFSDPTPRQQSYLGDVVDMLYGMFRSDPLCRISSEDVVTKLKEIKIEHAHDDAPDDPILRRMNTTPTPPGFTEVGWSRAPKDPAPVFLSFYQMYGTPTPIVLESILTDCT